ncbi:MAG TPA: phospholipid carrier-dependent glycosyltransferase [Thermoflexia bacterium]|nr:phospholipid carrier-dependent glycosyltransferase [Thermoflexia bacterium]
MNQKFSLSTRLLLLITGIGAALRCVALGSLPPGLHFDEAVYGLLALNIGHGHYPVFFSSYTGREPLYMYAMALVFRVVGANTFGIRLTSALIGSATIPLAYLLFRELFPSRRIALLTAALTALSYWHLTVSRNGYPNILIPPLECLALLFLWRGYRDNRKECFALGGACIGLVLYTYLAARLFPVTVALFFGYTLLVDRPRARSRFWGIALAALASIVVFSPLGYYFINHPHDFWERANQVLATPQATPGAVWRLYGSNILKTWGGFFIKGDPRWHYNLPGKPIFDPLLAPFFLLGIGRAFKNWRKPEYALLPIWVVGMCLPALLTFDRMPQGQRMFGIIPGVFGLAALGLDATLHWFTERWGPERQRLLTGALLALLLWEGISTTDAYFCDWTQQPETYHIFDTAYQMAAEKAQTELAHGNTVVLPSYHYQHPTVSFCARDSFEQLVWSVGGDNLVLPQRGGEQVLYLRPADNPPNEIIQELTARLTEPLARECYPTGDLALTIRRLKPGILAEEANASVRATFSDELAVLDWELPASAPRDQPVPVLVHWRALRAVEGGRDLRLHLTDENGVLWTQSGSGGYLAAEWQAGDTVYQNFTLPLPAGIPAGNYEVRLLLSREGAGQLPVTENGIPSGVSLSLGEVTLEPAGAQIVPVAEAGTSFGDTLLVRETDWATGELQPGEKLHGRISWQAEREPPEDYSATITLVDEDGKAAHVYTVPLAYQYPTSAWQRGEVVGAQYRLPVPELAGPYRVQLTVAGLTGELLLGEITIGGLTRLYETPSIAHPVTATLGAEITWLGYALPTEADLHAGGTLPVQLYWRADSAPARNYKVFVHLSGANGELYAQDDSVPVHWQRPTSGWAAGEIIIDAHELVIPPTLPAGRYTLALGMYDAETLQRLPLRDANGQAVPDDWLVFAEVQIN